MPGFCPHEYPTSCFARNSTRGINMIDVLWLLIYYAFLWVTVVWLKIMSMPMNVQWASLPEWVSNGLPYQNSHYGVVDEPLAFCVVAHCYVYVFEWQFYIMENISIVFCLLFLSLYTLGQKLSDFFHVANFQINLLGLLKKNGIFVVIWWHLKVVRLWINGSWYGGR